MVVEWTTVKWTAVQNCSFYSFYSIHQEIRKVKSIKKIPLKVVAKWLSNKRQFNVHKNLGLPVKENTLLYLENIFMIYPVKGHIYLNFLGCLFISEWAVAQRVRQETAVCESGYLLSQRTEKQEAIDWFSLLSAITRWCSSEYWQRGDEPPSQPHVYPHPIPLCHHRAPSQISCAINHKLLFL